MTESPVLTDALAVLSRTRGLLDRLGDLASLVDGLPISARWDKLDLDFSNGTRIDIAHLRLRQRGETDPFLDADLRFAFVGGKLESNPTLHLYEPVQFAVPPEDFYLDNDCLAFRYTDQGVNRWLRRAAADVLDEGSAAPTPLTAQLIFGKPQRELRLDWPFANQRTFALPGIKVTTPASGRFSLILTSNPGSAFDRLALVLTVPKGAQVIGTSTFAWGRDAGADGATNRELQNQPDAAPLFMLTLTAPNGPDDPAETSIVLLDMSLKQIGPGAPKFLRQLQTALPGLKLTDPMTRCIPAPLDAVGPLHGWSGSFKLNTNAFTLPFLKNDSLDQMIKITGPGDTLKFDPGTGTVLVPIGIEVHVGPLLFDTEVPISFNIETFALHVEHNKGLELFTKNEVVNVPSYLGLAWSLKGVKEGERFHHLTLVTDNYNYQLKQAPGASFTISYAGISEEPINFTVTNLVINAKGISLKATVNEEPVRLKGLNTKFTFRNSGFEIIDNHIHEFTLGGSGPLPPDLVGEATANIWLRFVDNGSGLKLWEGTAALQGTKLLDCKASRFRFSVDRIGLSFVEEGQFHLYFTLTGSAEFVLASGDDTNGALAWLPAIKITMVDCPLTGDMSVIARHVDFLITLPKPISFSFLGCFEMEIRAFGFYPQSPIFDGDGAMSITGQLKFAQGDGDNANNKRDYHKLYIGLPKKGSFLPRIHFEQIGVSLAVGELFKLEGFVKFDDSETRKGFSGEGMLQLPGLPTIRAAFSFLRVRRDANSPWVRAWFIYLEVGRLSIGIQILPIYLREIGLGFGYRYTIASISAADKAADLKQLVKKLDELSHSQADLARLDAWEVDLEGPGESLRWTIVLRAMFSATSASEGIVYNQPAEEDLPCLYLFDAMIAFRSDFTFYISARGWINTNYNDFATNHNGVRERNLVSGYILLMPRQKRFLARLVSNPNGSFGTRPELPSIVEEALLGSRFAAALLIEPGLIHYELGWPNQLVWRAKLGPLEARYTGGFIFRVDFREETVVLGISYEARAILHVEGGVSIGIAGVTVRVHAEVAYGARLIGVLSLKDPFANSVIYGAIGLEIQIEIAIEFWIKLLFFKKSGTISLNITLTAGLEVALNGISPSGIGIRGTGTISLRLMGHGIRFGVNLGIREENVDTVLQRTQKYLSMGLEATEVAGVPGVGQGTPGTLGPATMVAERMLRVEDASRMLVLGSDERDVAFETPHYIIFVIHAPVGGWSHFVLLPKGEPEVTSESADEHPEHGFLPAPPTNLNALQYDFLCEIGGLDAANYELEQFIDADTPSVAASDTWDAIPDGRASDWLPRTRPILAWRANWGVVILEADGQASTSNSQPTDGRLKLQQYLRYAFVVSNDGLDTPLHDPDPFTLAPHVTADERVYNPTDSAFETAVRGAFEQFRGSPFFKFDETQLYDKKLKEAFQNTTTIYHPSGTLTAENQVRAAENQQADQIRGQVIQDSIADLRNYVSDPDNFKPESSLAFQMGLVFRFRPKANGAAPPWLDSGADVYPTIKQRVGPDRSAPDHAGPTRFVRPFNVSRTNFSDFPPIFRRVQQYASASTIAIAWELAWDHLAADELPGAQREPEHHLVHYQVRRRALDTNERDHIFTVKPAEVLHRDIASEPLMRLAPRFQIVDQFGSAADTTPEDLPATGRSYLYTITPVDVAGNSGRPLTLAATRYPTAPPRVPVDGRLVVRYAITSDALAPTPDKLVPAQDAQPLPPTSVEVEWTEPADAQSGPGIETYHLVFRRESTLPIGSYGLDAATSGGRSKLLPTSNARTLPTDITFKLDDNGLLSERHATLSLTSLRDAGVLPADATGTWRSDAWQVFFQTVSVGGVPSALAPVELVLQVDAVDADGTPTFTKDGQRRREERQPLALEWLTRPTRFPTLPPEDTHAQVGKAHVPMPDGDGVFPLDTGPLTQIAYHPHPAGIRCLRFRWNQGPSTNDHYPLALHAGYHLLEIDADAHTGMALSDHDLATDALRTLQEIQMVSAEDLALIPADTLATSRWEAWYPSTVRRAREPITVTDGALGTRSSPKPWYSWRESVLEWPEWPGLTDNGTSFRTDKLHPLLQLLLDTLGEQFLVDPQVVPLTQAADLPALINATPAQGDPYGWSVLQQFGLSTTFMLRDEASRQPITQEQLLSAVQQALTTMSKEGASGTLSAEDVSALYRHLHVELLFQAGQSIALKEGNGTSASALLVIIQVSLRPAVRQMLAYAGLDIHGLPDARVELQVTLTNTKPSSLINLSDRAAGQVELQAAGSGNTKPVAFTARLDKQGNARVLVRAEQLPTIEVVLPGNQTPLDTLSKSLKDQLNPADTATQIVIKPTLWNQPVALQTQLLAELAAFLSDKGTGVAELRLSPLTSFTPTDRDSLEFSQAPVLEERFGDGTASPYGENWLRLKWYVDALVQLGSGSKTRVPSAPNQIKDVLADTLAWMQRFFDHGGDVSSLTSDSLASTSSGPWLATAYPRAGSPAYATPDPGGRLTYDHLIEDKWAHIYRYYLRPYGRYDRLLHNLRTSPHLFDDVATRANQRYDALPDVAKGGLDVVLEREERIVKPMVLRSGRLDEEGRPELPVPPGRTWEVLVAQHPEQALSERNQTVARQLGFRQVAFTLVRRLHPDYHVWVATLTRRYAFRPDIITLVQEQFPQEPALLPPPPDVLDHLDLVSAPADDAAREERAVALRSIDLSLRVSTFQQGVLALQWEALPFFYEHQLLLIAQAASVVSEVNRVTQRDFEYCSPTPSASMVGSRTPAVSAVQGELVKRGQHIRLPLKRFWDALPVSAQQCWPGEDPEHNVDPEHRKLSELPDPEVIYQIIEFYSGNIEVQAELFFDQPSEAYQRRQLGQRFIATDPTVAPPVDPAHGDYTLETTVYQKTEDPLTQAYPLDALPATTRAKVSFREKVLVIDGVLTRDDLQAIFLAWFQDANPLPDQPPAPANDIERDKQTIRQLYRAWFSAEPVSQAFSLDALPGNTPAEQLLKADLAHLVDFVPSSECALAWSGPLSDADRAALLTLPGDDEFKAAIARLVAAASAPDAPATVFSSAPVGFDQVPAGLPVGITVDLGSPANGTPVRLSIANGGVVQISRAGTSFDTLSWTGPMFDDQFALVTTAFGPWSQIAVVGAAVKALMAATEPFDTRVITKTLPVPRPQQDELPAELRDHLLIGKDSLTWQGGVPTDAQRTQVNTLPGDPGFLGAVQQLMAAYDARVLAPLGLPQDALTPVLDLPDDLKGHVAIEGAGVNRSLTWGGPKPTDAQITALRAQATGDNVLPKAFRALITALETSHTVAMPVVLPRPKQQAIDPLLQPSLKIEPTQLTWTGRLHSQQHLDALARLRDNAELDPAFRTAIGEIIAETSAFNASVPLGLRARPLMTELGELTKQLLVGRTLLRYHGIMSIEEGQALQSLVARVATPADVPAIQRLYTLSLNRGLRGRELRVRARRGSAAPSGMVAITAEPLAPRE